MNIEEDGINPKEINKLLDNILHHFSHANGLSREFITQLLKENMQKVAKYYQEMAKDGKSNHANGSFISKMTLLQDVIFADFLENKNDDWLQVLISQKMSPLSPQQIADYKNKKEMSLEEKKKEKAAKLIQNFCRSKIRFDLHQAIFKAPPLTHSLIDQDLNYIDDRNVMSKINGIVLELSKLNAVISSKTYHWTIIGNLKNILRNRYFYGNKRLMEEKIFFKKNAMTTSDERNGDRKVICCASYLVDPVALINVDNKLHDGLLRLTLDLTKIDNNGRYNQFFKISDFLSPAFHFNVKINNALSVNFDRKDRAEPINIKFNLNNVEVMTSISKKEEMIFYGDLYGINKFCLLKIFDIVNKMDNIAFKKDFYSYLAKLSDDEIRKVLVTFAQYLTVFSEYNFNDSLKLTDGLITEVYFCEHDKLVKTDNVSVDELSKMIFSLSRSKGEISMQAPLIDALPIISKKPSDEFTIYNNVLRFGQIYSTIDLTNMRNDAFKKAYVETRPSHAEDIKLDERIEKNSHEVTDILNQTDLIQKFSSPIFSTTRKVPLYLDKLQDKTMTHPYHPGAIIPYYK